MMGRKYEATTSMGWSLRQTGGYVCLQDTLRAAVNIVNDKSYDSMVYIKVVLEHMTALVKVRAALWRGVCPSFLHPVSRCA